MVPVVAEVVHVAEPVTLPDHDRRDALDDDEPALPALDGAFFAAWGRAPGRCRSSCRRRGSTSCSAPGPRSRSHRPGAGFDSGRGAAATGAELAGAARGGAAIRGRDDGRAAARPHPVARSSCLRRAGSTISSASPTPYTLQPVSATGRRHRPEGHDSEVHGDPGRSVRQTSATTCKSSKIQRV